MSFPRSYHVLYWLAQVFNIGSALAFGGGTMLGVRFSPWWYLVLLPGWVFFGAWRVVARRELRKTQAEGEALCAELDAALARYRNELEQ